MMNKKLDADKLKRKMENRRKASAAFIIRQRAAGFRERKLLITDAELTSIKALLERLRGKDDGEPGGDVTDASVIE